MTYVPETLFFLSLIVGLFGLFRWAFRSLPREEWQFFAVLPGKNPEVSGRGTTLTYYGLFTACGVSFAGMIFVVLMGSIGKSFPQIFLVMIPLFAVTIPSAKWIARWVEQKTSTLTIGGATFVGVLFAPWVIVIVNGLAASSNQTEFPIVPTLAALWVALAFGEGIGRLACLSFGCCYGRPLSACSPRIQRIFRPLAVQFSGKTKKAVYAGQCAGVPLFPIQGITAVINTGLGVMGMLCYVSGWYIQALIVVGIGTQGWRVISEIFRMDYRGGGRVSAYQWMALVGGFYAIAIAGIWMGSDYPTSHLLEGLRSVWDLQVLLFLQVLWLGIFFFTGVSRVTRAHVSTEVCYEQV